ncbi:anhydro-N-acetylmuramic acid kinase [Chitinibacteraceae bacterium HSL-7]
MLSPRLYIGLMTGTSLDGIDAVLVDFGKPQPVLLASHGQPLPSALRKTLAELQASTPNELETAALAGNALAEAYAEAVLALLLRAGVAAQDILAIGNHGQTIRHRPEAGYTLQIGNHARLAELTGITVVGDFRSRDIAAGGQGAPLVPAFHRSVFAHASTHRVIVNIGGIANLTDLPPGGEVIGFDTGPGNVLMDGWCERHLGKSYDVGGEWSAGGVVLPDLLALLQAETYFALPAPKSTGRDLFHMRWLDARLAGRRDRPEDVQATLVALTASTIADAVLLQAPAAAEVYLCGGGVHNTALVAELSRRLAACRVTTTMALGIDPDWVEAFAFAWLAERCQTRQSGNLPQVTGASGERILGAIWPA